MLNIHDENGGSCLILDLRGKPFSFFYWAWCFCGLVIYGLYYIEICSPLYLVCWVFIMNGYWILSSTFLCPWEDHIFILQFINVVYWYNQSLIDLQMLKHLYSIPGIKSHLIMVWILPTHCWIWLANILLRNFTSLFVRYMGLYF